MKIIFCLTLNLWIDQQFQTSHLINGPSIYLWPFRSHHKTRRLWIFLWGGIEIDKSPLDTFGFGLSLPLTLRNHLSFVPADHFCVFALHSQHAHFDFVKPILNYYGCWRFIYLFWIALTQLSFEKIILGVVTCVMQAMTETIMGCEIMETIFTSFTFNFSVDVIFW